MTSGPHRGRMQMAEDAGAGFVGGPLDILLDFAVNLKLLQDTISINLFLKFHEQESKIMFLLTTSKMSLLFATFCPRVLCKW